MRTVLSLWVLALAGCCSAPCNTMGWNFSVGKAAMAYTPAIVSQTAPVYGVSGLGAVPTYPTALAVQPRMMAAPPCTPSAAMEPIAAPRAMAAAPADCTMQKLCDALDRIEAKLGTNTSPKRLPAAGD